MWKLNMFNSKEQHLPVKNILLQSFAAKKKKSLLALLRVDSGGQLPVLLLAHQRPAVLNKTLLSLMGVQNFSSKRTLAAMENIPVWHHWRRLKSVWTRELAIDGVHSYWNQAHHTFHHVSLKPPTRSVDSSWMKYGKFSVCYEVPLQYEYMIYLFHNMILSSRLNKNRSQTWSFWMLWFMIDPHKVSCRFLEIIGFLRVIATLQGYFRNSHRFLAEGFHMLRQLTNFCFDLWNPFVALDNFWHNPWNGYYMIWHVIATIYN